MKTVFLTTSDPIYLPAFFDRVLAGYAPQTQAVYVVPPLYKGQTPVRALLRYWRTFGARGTMTLAARVLRAKVKRSSIQSTCARHGVLYSKVSDVNAPDFVDHLRRTGTELIVSVSCPQIFRQPLLELPPFGCLNIHGALLPLYRGVLPSFWMLANGERQAGVSIYFMNEQIDAGELCGQRTFEIEPEETLDSFLRRSKAAASELLIDVLATLEAGDLERAPLDLSQGSYYSWPDRDAVRQFRASGRRLW
jgi:methionyl-tRNA formyltransferase